MNEKRMVLESFLKMMVTIEAAGKDIDQLSEDALYDRLQDVYQAGMKAGRELYAASLMCEKQKGTVQ